MSSSENDPEIGQGCGACNHATWEAEHDARTGLTFGCCAIAKDRCELSQPWALGYKLIAIVKDNHGSSGYLCPCFTPIEKDAKR